MTDIYTRRFDQANRNWTAKSENNRMFLRTSQDWANNVLQVRGHIFLNDIQDMLGFDRTSQGQLVGWLKNGDGDGFVDFGVTEVEDEPGVFLLTFNPDGVMYDKI